MIELLAGLALGLGGSLHCAAMCGPIAIALPGKGSGSSSLQQVAPKIVYQLGRIVTYISLGAIIGLGGNWIALSGYSRTLSIASGIAMIAAIAAQLLWNREVISGRWVERFVAPLKQGLSVLLSRHGTLTHFGIGLLNGLLPCGMVTAALLGSLGTGSTITAAVFMGGFGIGTAPLMTAIAIGGSRISCEFRHKLRYAAPAISLVVASLCLLRGLALGIPYISPAAVSLSTPPIECSR